MGRIEGVTAVRPFAKDFDSVEAFDRAHQLHAIYQAYDKGYPDHADQPYPNVLECPKCGGIASVMLLTPIDEPIWRCRSGEHSYSESKFWADELGIDLPSDD